MKRSSGTWRFSIGLLILLIGVATIVNGIRDRSWGAIAIGVAEVGLAFVTFRWARRKFVERSAISS